MVQRIASMRPRHYAADNLDALQEKYPLDPLQ